MYLKGARQMRMVKATPSPGTHLGQERQGWPSAVTRPQAHYNTHGHKLRFPAFEKAQFVTECGIYGGFYIFNPIQNFLSRRATAGKTSRQPTASRRRFPIQHFAKIDFTRIKKAYRISALRLFCF
jgi:hypothetical protein